jgi:hypothetical protein
MRRTWLQIYEGFAIMLVLFTAMTNTMVIVGTAIVLLVIGLVAFPALRRTGTIAGGHRLCYWPGAYGACLMAITNEN